MCDRYPAYLELTATRDMDQVLGNTSILVPITCPQYR